MKILVDTNVLLRLANKHDERSGVAISARDKLLFDGHSLFVTPQNLIEFWAVCTRPRNANGLGLTVAVAEGLFQIAELGFPRVEDSDMVYRRWRELVSRYSVSGVQAHDAHLVASMLVHDVTHILTFNGRDFVRYTEIEVIDPLTVA